MVLHIKTLIISNERVALRYNWPSSAGNITGTDDLRFAGNAAGNAADHRLSLF